jgi:hypothetical protein
MRHIFVLDENVFLSAHTGKNAYNENDVSSACLVLEIAANCHKIAWNSELRRRYEKKSDVLGKSGEYSLLMAGASKIIFQMMTKEVKNLQNENSMDFGHDLCDDKHVISLAVFTSGILVTEDLRLKDMLSTKNIIAKHNMRIATPKQALSYAQEKC